MARLSKIQTRNFLRYPEFNICWPVEESTGVWVWPWREASAAYPNSEVHQERAGEEHQQSLPAFRHVPALRLTVVTHQGAASEAPPAHWRNAVPYEADAAAVYAPNASAPSFVSYLSAKPLRSFATTFGWNDVAAL